MKKILATVIIMVIGISSRAQSLVECQYLFDAGYWHEAESAYRNYLDNQDPSSYNYYKAMSLYGEVLYQLDRHTEADSLMKTAADHLAGKAITMNEEALEAQERYSYYSSHSSLKAWGLTQLNKINIKELINEGTVEMSVYNLSNPHLLQILALKNLKKGLILRPRKLLNLAGEIIYSGDSKYATGELEDLRMERCWTQYYYAVTNYYMMLQSCNNALSIISEAGISDGIYYAEALIYKATALSQLGSQHESLQLINQAIAIIEGTLGREHSMYAWALYHKGLTLGMMCELDGMLDCATLSADTYKKIFGEKNPNYSAALNETAAAYSMLGDTTREYQYYELALSANRKFLGDGALITGKQYYDMANAYCGHGNYDKALEYIKKASRIATTQTGVKSVFTADCLTLRAYINEKLGRYKIASGFLQGAIAIYSTALGDNSPKMAHALTTLGNCQYGQGNYGKASESITTAIAANRRNLADNFGMMTAQARNLYWENTSADFAAITRLCWKNPDDNPTTMAAYNNELISKGIKLSSEIEFSNIIANSGDAELMEKYSRLQECHQLINTARDFGQDENESTNIDSLAKAANQLEQELISACKEYGDMTRQIKTTFREVRKALKPNDVAIEFVKTQVDTSVNYGALILKAGWTAPKFVPLFSEYQYHSSYGTAIKPYTDTRLYEMVWKPMLEYFDYGSRIYFAPTGLLYSTAIEYAPIDTDNDLLMSDEYQIFRISSTRELANRREKPTGNKLALYGGILYDTDTSTMVSESRQYAQRGGNHNFLRSLFSKTGGVKANYLPGTEKESKAIYEYMNESKYSVDYYTGQKANEESFKNLSGQNLRIIHIATHGFYMDDEGGKFPGDNNLLLSGLLMSGCNNILNVPEGVDDGILTAREISYLDFRNTDMVVLSACETALGKITDDGVYGLQRGFKKAGANTIIMSLWPVNDYATRLLMSNFYKYMKEGYSKHEAFQNSQRDLRAHNGVNPSHWAAFIMLDGE